jgi:uncharacterized membrane protein YbaN (DUF454 family)
VKKILFLILGSISLIIGLITTITPFPTIPFIVVACLCFSQSSEKLSRQIENSRLYKERIQPIIEKLQRKRDTQSQSQFSENGSENDGEN